jgi:acetyl esterase/lipase
MADEALQDLIDALSALPGTVDATDLDGRRRQARQASELLFERFAAAPVEVASVEEHLISSPGPGVSAEPAEIGVRVYRPAEPGPRPAHLYIHGGGFWLGSPEERAIDAWCRDRCRRAGVVVVAVDYRLAPEFPYPAGLEDCYAALTWLHRCAGELGVDPGRLSVGGMSAGGNLSVALALLTHARGGPALDLQVLEVPWLDVTLASARAAAHRRGPGVDLTVADLEECQDFYLSDPGDAGLETVSPLAADDLSAMPPTLVLTGGRDVLHEEGAAFAARLRESGVPVVHVVHELGIHGSICLTATWEPARQWQDQVVAALRDGLGPDAATDGSSRGSMAPASPDPASQASARHSQGGNE